MTLRLEIHADSFPLAETFRISRGSKTSAEVIRVVVADAGHSGQGESVPYGRYGETLASVSRQIEDVSTSVCAGISRSELLNCMPAGAARNAIDCALWDLDAKKTGKRAWKLAGLNKPGMVTTAYTLSLDTPERMRDSAAKNAGRALLKVKLGTDNDIERLEAVRSGAPDSGIIVDANEGWDGETWLQLQPRLLELGILLVEQPLPAEQDSFLAGHRHLVPVCADESCHTSDDLEQLRNKYDFVNIKLDKTGGLTEALKMKQRATDLEFGIMTGCMVGTSLAMAPAMLLAQNAEFVDLDGPLLLGGDRTPGLQYKDSFVYPSEPELWG